MQLSQFPTDILSRLSEQFTFTDLVILHACGNAVLNAKLGIAPLHARVMTVRCVKYYNLKLTSRFRNIIRVLHSVFVTGYRIEHIPPTAKIVVSKKYIDCLVPRSVDELTVEYIDKGTTFERNPLELSVTVKRAFISAENVLKYITAVDADMAYNPRLINLKKIYLPPGCKHEPIQGIEYIYSAKCPHARIDFHTVDLENMWSSKRCKDCGLYLEVLFKNGTSCSPIPPCMTIVIKNGQLCMLEQIVKVISRDTEYIKIEATISDINSFCAWGGFDLIPSFIKKVMILFLVDDHKKVALSPKFYGLDKEYPFFVCIGASYNFTTYIAIESYTGIDEVDWQMFDSEGKRRRAMRMNPKLSII